MSYLRFLCSFTHRGVKDFLNIWVTWRVSYKRLELFTLREHMGSPLVFDGVRVVRLFRFLCCIHCFVCLHHMSCVPNFDSFSGLSILDCPFGFLWHLFASSLPMFSFTHTWQSLCNNCIKENRITEVKPLISLSCILMMIC